MNLAYLRRVEYLATLMARLLAMAVFLIPFYVIVCYAFKSRLQIATTGLQLPTGLDFKNFRDAIAQTNRDGMPFWRIMNNTVITTLIGTILLTMLSSLSAYALARRKSLFYSIMYSIMVFTLLVPLQAYMFPLYVSLKKLHLLNTLLGFVFVKTGALLGFSIIVMTGFVKAIPREMEESAFLDGASLPRTFLEIILPLMKPILLTSIVINALNIWNDFATAFIVIITPIKYIVSLLQFSFMGTNSIKINLAFALFSMTMVPIVVLYLVLQRYIVSGIIMGSLKG
jgi:raffinose/stachyose/melibiose transport system permease protein